MPHGHAKRCPFAEVVALDWPSVLSVAAKNARNAGVSERYTLLGGNALELDYGANYDLVLLTNFLHHFDMATCTELVRRVYAALSAEGRAVCLEFVPNEDRVTPAVAGSFAITMLASTPSGDAYTFSEYDRMFREAGFTRSELHSLQPTFQQLIISYKGA
jgi:cyclopropane fatty-acyl-phospholipid synthase-like methyltransferase